MCKYCALLSYTQFNIIAGLKTNSLFKGATFGSSVHSLKHGYPKQMNLSIENLSTINIKNKIKKER